ncbi:caspase, EACC1-associated type [Spirillospora sp. CA-294931]|uniref:caspase, EACC1-associated type n=1 Tax=Spirillospora sp. CA-294931 TaxID=3240042 RepID=UPI003D8D134D
MSPPSISNRNDSRVVLVGTARYADAGLPDLPAVANNLSALQRAFTRGPWGLPQDRCTVLLDPEDPATVLGALHDAASDTGDTLVFYYSGHGLANALGIDEQLLLGMPRSSPHSRRWLSLSFDAVREIFLDPATTAKRKVVILDCCYAGLAGGMSDSESLGGSANVTGSYVLCAAGPTSRAVARPGAIYTEFTGALLDLHDRGLAGAGPTLSMDTVYRWLVQELPGRGYPRPQQNNRDLGGQISFIVNTSHREDEPAAPPPAQREKQLLNGRYELGEVIGTGSLSEVYRARDVRLNRVVAVKFLRADLAGEPMFLERFRREAQSVRSLNHPAIVAVYDVGEERGGRVRRPYVVAEFVDGESLREWIHPPGRPAQPLDPKRALFVLDGVLGALDHAHGVGILHRDIKPAKIMVNRQDRAKVMDFGLARVKADPDEVTGTAHYMSPEQCTGKKLDGRTDVYSTGCVLYEMLTGAPPFRGDSRVAIAYEHVRTDPIPPSRIMPGLPEWADGVVLTAMAKAPEHRYQSAAEFRSAVLGVLGDRRPPPPRRRRWPRGGS